MTVKHPTARVVAITALSSIALFTLLTTLLPSLLMRTSSLPASQFIRHAMNLADSHQCSFPLVYNKPPKTASSFIQQVISNWTEDINRPNYVCAKRPMLTNIRLHECIPVPSSTKQATCGVVNCHLYLDSHAKSLFADRLPEYRLLTSTRNAAHRIVSFFLHSEKIRLDQTILTGSNNESAYITKIHSGLHQFLDEYEPWRLYNYHTGEDRSGQCPLTQSEKVIVVNMVARYHLVIDANLRSISNAILAHHGLFQLPHQIETRTKDRGAYKLSLPSDLKSKLWKKSCVEIMLHQAMQLRMASLYERATGESCISKNDTCVANMEREALKSNWIF